MTAAEIKKTSEQKYIGDELFVDMEIDRIDGDYLDTRVQLVGEFWVGGSLRNEFVEKLERLVNEYRI